MNDLGLLMEQHGTDKFHPHHYEHEYKRHFAPFRTRSIRLLEIGIGGTRSNDGVDYRDPASGGQSLKVWRDYFPLGDIHGLDIHDKRGLGLDGVKTWQGDQANPKCLEAIAAEAGPFDIIIDDGSHMQAHVISTFLKLFPSALKPGGMYVIEDIGTAYDVRYDGQPDPLRFGTKLLTTVNLLAFLIDGLHCDSWVGGSRWPSDVQKLVSSVHISRNLAFIYRA